MLNYDIIIIGAGPSGIFCAYELLEHKLGVEIDTATQSIQAVMATYRIAALLELAEQTCMLKVNRTAYTKSGECFEYSESSYVSSRYMLTMTLKR